MTMLRFALIGVTVSLALPFVAAGQAPTPPVSSAPAGVPSCPPNGYSKPWYGGFGDNDGVIRGYEIASPCVVKEAIAAATALGMARGKPLGVKNVSTVRFGATGTLAEDTGNPIPHTDIDIAISYMIPAIRLTTRDGMETAPQKGRVFADGKAWDEAAPGQAGRRASARAAKARAPLALLTPFGAIQAIIEAEGHATVSTEDGHTVLSGTSPYDGFPVKVTLDDKSLPIAAEVREGRNIYRATFGSYKDDFEPPYLVVFPDRMTWTLNGKPYADLKITRFKSNPYVIFPEPTETK